MSLRALKLSSLALLLALTVAASPRADAVRFHAADGTSVAKALVMNATLTMEGGTASVGGEEEEMPAEQEPIGLEVRIEVTDQYTRVAEGEIVECLRTFDGLLLELQGEETSNEVDSFADLEGSTVKFTRSEEGKVEKSFHEEEGDAGLLVPLRLDMDFRALLPAGDVSADDTWKSEDPDMLMVFLPGGMPGSDSDDQNLAELILEVLVPLLNESAGDFAIVCTYKGSDKEGELQLGEIAFEFEGEASGDATDLVLGIASLADPEDSDIPENIDATADMEFSGEGTLVWNMTAGHVHAFEMAVDAAVELSMDFSQDFGGESMDISFTADLGCEMSWELKTE